MKNMGKNVLVNEIVNFCFDYGVIHESIDEDELKSIVYNHLEEEPFIENLINTIIIKSKSCPTLDIDRLKDLLIELEKIRLELEYKDYK
ncbi:MAG: hypothetical protein FWC91_14355 [Defluviitaleaceae bacterium]|nr:hypothetical protein [Defluviitaleaceae bacterium]